MRRTRIFIIRFFLLFMLIFSTNEDTTFNHFNTAEASVKTPSLTAEKKTLYVGYHSYTLEIKNISNDAHISYSSSDSKVAAVTSEGIIKPITSGFATITVVVNQNNKIYRLYCKVTVRKPSITLIQSCDYINIGDTFPFKVKTEGLSEKVSWSVSDTSVATISTSGKLSAITGGSITVFAKAGGLTAKSKVIIGTNSLGTFSTDITVFETTTIWIYSSGTDEKEKLSLNHASSKIADYQWGDWSGSSIPLTINPLKTGTDTITITSNVSNDRLLIHMKVIDKPIKKELTSTEIYAADVPCTVEVSVTTNKGNALGSGFFIGDDRLVTNYHVIEGATKIVVKTNDNEEYKIERILGFNASLDIAVLEIRKEHKYLKLCQNVAGGEEVFALGSPFGLTGTMSKGMVSTASRVIDGVDYIQTDASISNGNSGGPLINSYGEVVGINTMYMENGQNLNFAINIKELQKIYLNHPISIEDYHKMYEKYWSDWFYANLIYEDTGVSKNPEACQTAYSGYGVTGTIKPGEAYDLYYFSMDEAGYLYAAFMSDSMDHLAAQNFSITTYSGTPVNFELSSTDPETETKSYKAYLDKGQYLVKINLTDGYQGEGTDYLFSLEY